MARAGKLLPGLVVVARLTTWLALPVGLSLPRDEAIARLFASTKYSLFSLGLIIAAFRRPSTPPGAERVAVGPLFSAWAVLHFAPRNPMAGAE